MKNRYVKPATLESVIVIEEIIATSQVFIKVGGDVENATTDASTSRAEWGDLWK